MTRFSQTLLEHARYPSNQGKLENASHIGKASLSGNPPFIFIYLRVINETIVDAKFESRGCGVTTAVCSATTELLVDRKLENVPKQDEITKALDGIPPDKSHCIHVVLKALVDAAKLD